jgi:hypothetical protein
MKHEEHRDIETHFGNLLIEIGKLAFASLVLGNTLAGKVDQVMLLIISLAGSVTFILLGSWLVLKRRRKK